MAKNATTSSLSLELDLIAALREASRALTELDPFGEHHNATLIDEALGKAKTPLKTLDRVDVAYMGIGAERAWIKMENALSEAERTEVSDHLSGHTGFMTEVMEHFPVLEKWFSGSDDDDMNSWGAILQYEVIEPYAEAIGDKIISGEAFKAEDVLASILPKREPRA